MESNCLTQTAKKRKCENSSENEVLYFQDFFSTNGDVLKKSESSSDFDPAEAFFELANAPIVGFKVSTSSSAIKCEKSHVATTIHERKVLVHQDNACQSHTGGIVWETAYLLANYLIMKNINKDQISSSCLGKTLEVGSGCGMLGLVIAISGLSSNVVMTETRDVMENLIKNVEYNTSLKKHCNTQLISPRQLRWDSYKEDIKKCQSEGSDDLDAHSFDTIIGTDVIFSTKLVKPLLKTLRKMSHERTNIYLCVQIRCADSHSLLLKKASKYDFECVDCSDEFRIYPTCGFGIDLECKLLHMTVKKNKNSSKRKKEKSDSKMNRKKSKNF